jgi:heptosyltransferase-2/heptosyltransferase-3
MTTIDQQEAAWPESDAPGILNPDTVERILVCQQRQIGDVILATPAIELLARRFPKAQIHVFTEKKCVPILENNPYVHTVWPVEKEKLPTLLHEFAFYRKVAAQGFDLVVDFQQLPRCRAVTALSRAPVRLSFPPRWLLRPLYTHWAQPKPAYAAAYKTGVLEPLGIRWQGERPRLYLTDEERASAEKLLASLGLDGRFFISVDVTHKRYTRCWPARHYAALVDMLAEEMPDLHFFLPYGPGEEEEAKAVRELCACKERVAVPFSQLRLRELPACMERASLHLGNCSSPRHMAVALGIPTFTILGAGGEGCTFPSPEHRDLQIKELMDMPCQPCRNSYKCSFGVACMEKLEPQLVLPHVMKHLREHGKGFSFRGKGRH